MKIQINNKTTETQAQTIDELARELGLPEKGVAIAKSNTMVPHGEWSATPLEEGDSIVIIKAACGG